MAPSPPGIMASRCAAHTISTAFNPIRYPRSTHLTLSTPLRILTLTVACSTVGALETSMPMSADTSRPVFRPGSGAGVWKPRSPVPAAARLSEGHLPELVSVKADAPDHALAAATDKPLLSLRNTPAIAAGILALFSLAAVGAMMNRHSSSHSGHRPLGSAHIPAHHIGKIPPTFDPRFEDRYSFRQYMREMQHWVLVTDLPPHQQAVMILKHLGGAAHDLIS